MDGRVLSMLFGCNCAIPISVRRYGAIVCGRGVSTAPVACHMQWRHIGRNAIYLARRGGVWMAYIVRQRGRGEARAFIHNVILSMRARASPLRITSIAAYALMPSLT